MKALNKLLNISGERLSPNSRVDGGSLRNINKEAVKDLILLLQARNGFYAFESALHVFPFDAVEHEISIVEWNQTELWIDDYAGLADGALFFAEDVFGGQFCIRSDGVHIFEPETGEFEFLSPDLNGWAVAIMNNFEIYTGYPLAHEWQEVHGPLERGKRLLPKIPFVLKGDFSVDNLYSADAVKGMKWRADLARQVRDLKDGESIQISIVE